MTGPSADAPGSAVSTALRLTVVAPCYNERGNVAKLVERLETALIGIRWEAVFVDDNSPDKTADEVRRIATLDPRIRCIQRIGRRGLSSAVIEGALSSSADYIAVIDADLQHDERRLPELLARLRQGDADIVVASRYVDSDHSEGLANVWRQRLSSAGIALVQRLLKVRLLDPMSGYFVLRRPLFEEIAPRLSGQGFKILLDLILSSPRPLRVAEIQAEFFSREEGESKLDILVLFQFISLIVDKACRGLLPTRFLAFALIGAIGVLVNLAVLLTARRLGLTFEQGQAIGTIAALAANFQLNNAITYRDQRLRGPRLWQGMLIFAVGCGAGAVANIGVAQTLYNSQSGWTAAGAIGAAIGVVWNYAISGTLVWRRR